MSELAGIKLWGVRRVSGRRSGRAAFSLIELLVVIGIVALLIAILMPVLGRAQTASLVSVCLSHQRQVGIGFAAYAVDYEGDIPRGPDDRVLIPPDTTFADVAYNVIWFPPSMVGGDGMYNSHGILLDGYVQEPRVMLCPDAPKPRLYPGQLEDIGTNAEQVAVSLNYRNLDQATGGKLEDMGRNETGEPASMLLWDLAINVPAGNPFGVAAQHNVNHKSTATNALYRDGHAESFAYVPEYFLIPQSAYLGPIDGLLRRLDNIVTRLDHAAVGDPADAPQLP